MYLLSACCISPQDTFSSDDALFCPGVLDGNRWQCIEPDYKFYISDPTLRRRMSRVVKMGVAAALRCVKHSNVQPDAIITATGLGCLADTEKFLDTLITNHESRLNPTPFIQSTFNTVGAQVALLLGNRGYNTTFVHRGNSFESALLDAIMQIEDGSAQNVLVGGFDEITDTSFEIMRRLGFWKKNLADSSRLYNENSKGTAAGEGATFFMFGKNPPVGKPSIKISGLRHFNESTNNGTFFGQIDDFLSLHQKTISDIDLLILGNNGDKKGDRIYKKLVDEYFLNNPYCFFKNLCGEYPTASAFSLYLATRILEKQEVAGIKYQRNIEKKIKNILIYNHYQQVNHNLICLELQT